MADVLPPPPMSGGAAYAPHSEGVHPMAVVDIVDLGLYPDQYQGGPVKLQHKVALVFASGEQQENGELVLVSQEFTYSLNEKSNLRRFLQQFAGKQLTDEEAQKIQLHKLVGRGGLVTVEHKQSKSGRAYAFIRSVSPLVKGMAAPVVEGYERPAFFTKRKEEYAKLAAPHLAPAHDDFPPALEADDDDLGF